MDIKIKSLELENFKGIKNLKINFNDRTNIYGANATGKTTIMDAFTWLLFDKDSKDRKAFDIKTIDRDGNVINMLDHTVTGVLSVDGVVLTLQKTYKEQWTKKRGSINEEFTGHTTDYLINSVPVKKKEFDERIEGIIDESTFKLLTNPKFFNETLDKKQRREVLLSLIDKNIDIEKVIELEPSVVIIRGQLKDYTIDELEKMAKTTVKKVNDELKTLPARMDELSKMLVEDKDLDALDIREKTLLAGLKRIETDMSAGNNIEAIQEKREELLKLKEEKITLIANMREQSSKELNELKEEIISIESVISEEKSEYRHLEQRLGIAEEEIVIKNEHLVKLRKEWEDINSDTMDSDSLICPTCDREYDLDKVDEIVSTYNLNKSNSLEDITNTAKEIKKTISDLEEEIEAIKNKMKSSRAFIDDRSNDLTNCYKVLEKKKKDLESNIAESTVGVSEAIGLLERDIEVLEGQGIDKDLENKKSELEGQLKELKTEILAIERNKEVRDKIHNYSEREKDLASEVERQQAIIFACEEYRKAVASILEKEVNTIFSTVDFKLFDKQINGGITEVCEALIDGVPYSSANNAAQINSGIEIINVLSEHHGVRAPVFVDNAESVNELVETDSQLITLSVSEDKKLLIK